MSSDTLHSTLDMSSDTRHSTLNMSSDTRHSTLDKSSDTHHPTKGTVDLKLSLCNQDTCLKFTIILKLKHDYALGLFC